MNIIAYGNRQQPSKEQQKLVLRLGMFFLGLLVIFVIARQVGLFDNIVRLKGWIKQQGIWGIAVFILLYVAVTVTALPRSGLTVLGGVIFGSFWGVIIVTIASVTGAGLAFLIARYLARDSVEKWVQSKPRLKNLYDLSETYGAFIVALLRMIPLSPTNLLNFAFGLTKMRFASYLFWSLVTMLLNNALFVVGADAIMEGFSEQQIPWLLLCIILGLGLVVLVLSRFALTHINRRKEIFR